MSCVGHSAPALSGFLRSRPDLLLCLRQCPGRGVFLPGDTGHRSRTLCECREWEVRQNPPCPQDMAVVVGMSRHTIDHSE